MANDIRREEDAAARARALGADGSFLVRAPAGSGKTELLIQRFLRLLATVEEPEAIVALTFSRKAAAEMRKRLLQALEAKGGEAPAEAHARLTWELAAAAREREAARGWRLRETPARLRVMTLDALALGLVERMPWLSRFGAAPRPTEAAEAMYAAAAKATLARIEHGGGSESDGGAAAARRLLRHLHADLAAAEKMLAALLEYRDQWLGLIAGAGGGGGEELRGAVEAEIRKAAEAELAAARMALRGELALPEGSDLGDWRALAGRVLTDKGTARKKGPCPELAPELCAVLHRVAQLPDAAFTPAQWEVVEALFTLLPLGAAELRLEFAARGECDFTEITLAARQALRTPESGVGFALDAQIRHLFVDEFQDTSRGQFELIRALTAEWSEGDGRTLFLVGDPMQSIYGWRNAELGLLLRAARQGRMGGVGLETLQLSANYRSRAALVAWCNAHFGAVFPPQDDLATEAAGFSPAVVPKEKEAAAETGAAVTIHGLPGKNPATEAVLVAELVERELAAAGERAEIAILAQNRGQLRAILPELGRRGIRCQGVKLQALGESPVVGDLLALTRALRHPADRIAWLAVLRAPWCGLTLGDLHALCGDAPQAAIEELAQDGARRARLSADGQQRLERVAAIMAEAARYRGRLAARPWVEWCWRRLGGAELASGGGSEAAAYLQLLEEWERRGALDDADGLSAAVEKLHAPPDPAADARVKAMTMHQAKGLEFDTVILPGLGRWPKTSDGPLLRWSEQPGEEEESQWWIAPKPEAGESELLYEFLGERERRRREQEQLRLLYVAATRARRRLHLLAFIPTKNGGMDLGVPDARSPLARIWPAVRDEFEAQFAARRSGASVEEESAAEELSRRVAAGSGIAPSLRRVAAGWSPAAPGADVAWSGEGTGAPVIPTPRPQAGELQRQIGIGVHALLQWMAEHGTLQWEAARLRAALLAAGTVPEAMATAMARATEALERTRRDPRGRWILEAHPGGRCEWALSGITGGTNGSEAAGGEVTRKVIDRSFLDADGARWIIDFKITGHGAGGREAFLDQQMELYRPQLEAYAALVEALEPEPTVRCGLYFPLLGGWRELLPHG